MFKELLVYPGMKMEEWKSFNNQDVLLQSPLYRNTVNVCLCLRNISNGILLRLFNELRTPLCVYED